MPFVCIVATAGWDNCRSGAERDQTHKQRQGQINKSRDHAGDVSDVWAKLQYTDLSGTLQTSPDPAMAIVHIYVAWYDCGETNPCTDIQDRI
jgi:hypothetical protein